MLTDLFELNAIDEETHRHPPITPQKYQRSYPIHLTNIGQYFSHR
jgi:hypothetical protein